MRTKSESIRRLERRARRLGTRWMRLPEGRRTEKRLSAKIKRLEIRINKVRES
jgi:hypothetical protein